uniref:Translocation and assembly module TamB C-terminal domain-containing protein n=1 Tax=Magnetococcus massalia (strain MO-1) TaxID=451514 RepID=A0A1S7LCH7_MAGMO|nr:conserved exported protein of unknown function [Candidatus Magnetococcus massalia]
MVKTLSWLGRLLLALLLLILLLPPVAWQFQPVRERVQTAVEEQAKQQGVVLSFGAAGLRLADLQLQSLQMADAQGVWLDLEQLRLQWHPAALLRGELHLAEVSAARIDVARAPVAPAAAEQQQAPTAKAASGEAPTWLLNHIKLEQLSVTSLRLGRALTGTDQPMVVKISGALGQAGRLAGQRYRVSLQGVEETPIELMLDAQLQLEPLPVLTLSGSGALWGGLGAQWLAAAPADRHQFTLKGEGLLSQWRGELALDSPAWGLLKTPFRLTQTDHGSKLLLDGAYHAESARQLPADTKTLLKDQQLPLQLQIEQTADGMKLQGLALAGNRWQLQGGATLEGERVAATLQVVAEDLASFSPLAKQPLSGAAEIGVVVSGSLPAPTVRIATQLKDFSHSAAEVKRIVGQLHLVPKTAGSYRVVGDLKGSLKLAQAPPPYQNWQPEVGLDITWSPNQPLKLAKLTIQEPRLQLNAHGEWAIPTQQGRIVLKGQSASLTPLLTAHGVEGVTGSAQLYAEVKVSEGLSRVDLTTNLTGKNLAKLPGPWQVWLGSQPNLAVKLQAIPEEQVELSHLLLTTPHATAELAGMVDLADGQLALHGGAKLPQLQALAAPVEQPMAGEVGLELEIAGALQNPSVTAKLQGKQLQWQQQPLPEVRLQASAEQLAQAPQGELLLQADQHGEQISLKSGFQLSHGGERLSLSSIQLRAPQTRMDGQWQVDLKQLLMDGQLTGKVAQLQGWQKWHPLFETLKGAVAWELTGQGERVQLALTGDAITQPGLELKQIEIDSEVAGAAQGSPELDLTTRIKGLIAGDAQLADIKIAARGSPQDLAFELQGQGDVMGPLELMLKGELQQAEAMAITLSQLQGRWDETPYSLRKPWRVELLDAQQIHANPLKLKWGDGGFSLALAKKQNQLQLHTSGDLGLQSLPLAKAYGLGGRLAWQGEFDTPLDRPSGVFELKALKITPPQGGEGEPLNATIELALHEGQQVKTELALTGLGKEAIQGQVRLPLTLSLAPFSLELGPQTPLQAQLTGPLALDRLLQWVESPESQRLAGELALNLSLAGTIGQPLLGGEIRMDNGLLEDAKAGLMLSEIQMVTKLEGQKVLLEQLAAKDGESGTMKLSGAIELQPKAQFPFDFTLAMQDMTLLRRDDATANLSSDLSLRGTAQKFALGGEVTLNRANLFLPDPSGGPDVETLVVHRRGEAPAKAEEEQKGAVGDLDLKIKMPGQLFVRGFGLESEWLGELQIKGTTVEPQVLGELGIKQGKLDFMGRRFDLNEGELSFTGDVPPIPQLNVVTQTQTPSILAKIILTGPATKPELTLESEPSRPQDEILSQILFERDQGKLTASEALKLAQALNTLRSGGPGVMDRVQQSVGIDRLEMKGDSLETGAVSVGKYLSEKVYLEIEKGLAPGSRKVRVEMELGHGVQVETDINEDNVPGLGIEWSRDY